MRLTSPESVGPKTNPSSHQMKTGSKRPFTLTFTPIKQNVLGLEKTAHFFLFLNYFLNNKSIKYLLSFNKNSALMLGVTVQRRMGQQAPNGFINRDEHSLHY